VSQCLTPPRELFTPWGRAQRAAGRLAREAPPAPALLRSTGFLEPELAKRVADWFVGPPTAPADAVRIGYEALELEIGRLSAVVQRVGVRIRHVHGSVDRTPVPRSCAPARVDGAQDERLRCVASTTRQQ
jgi:hypothetical protein